MASIEGGYATSGVYKSRCWLRVGVTDNPKSDYAQLRIQGCVKSGDDSGKYNRMANMGVTVQIGHNGNDYQNVYALYNYAEWVGWNDKTWSIKKKHNSQTYSCWCKYWGSTVNGYGAAPTSGEVYLNVTIPSKDWRTFKFNANYEGGGETSQWTYWGESDTLPPALERPEYNFLGWNTRSDGQGRMYAAGGTYSDLPHENMTFYAIWERKFIPPVLKILDSYRSNENGEFLTKGTYATIKCNYIIDNVIDPTNQCEEFKICLLDDKNVEILCQPVTITNLTDNKTIIINGLEPDRLYTILLSLRDKHQLVSNSVKIEANFPTIEMSQHGKALGLLGHAGSEEGLYIANEKINIKLLANMSKLPVNITNNPKITNQWGSTIYKFGPMVVVRTKGHNLTMSSWQSQKAGEGFPKPIDEQPIGQYLVGDNAYTTPIYCELDKDGVLWYSTRGGPALSNVHVQPITFTYFTSELDY